MATRTESTPNVALHSAIFLSKYKTQRAVSLVARIPEARLSAIVRGRIAATDRERRRLSDALGQSIDHLFPPSPPAASSVNTDEAAAS